MTLDELKNILESLGIRTRNFYTKKSFIYNEEPSIGCYPRELKEDFYFHNNFDDKIYMISFENIQATEFDVDDTTEKYIIPLHECTVIYPKEKTISPVEATTEKDEFVELEDNPFSQMTIRDYFAIKHLRPVSNREWLNTLIKEHKKLNEWVPPKNISPK